MLTRVLAPALGSAALVLSLQESVPVSMMRALNVARSTMAATSRGSTSIPRSLSGPDRVKFARDIYTWIHALIVAGVIVTATAAEEILLHPKESVEVSFRVMFAAGLAMFFGGIVAAAARAIRRVAKERLVATPRLFSWSWSVARGKVSFFYSW